MTKERSKSPHPSGAHLPTVTPVAEPSPVVPLPPLPRLHRRSRSRSKYIPTHVDKRPISFPRSPKRHRRDSRSRHQGRRSSSRDDSMSPCRPHSVTLRSNSPRHREVLHQRDEQRRRDDYNYSSTTPQPPSWHDYHYDQPSTSDKSEYHDYSTYPDKSSGKNGSPGSLGKTSPSLSITRIPPDGSTTQSHTTSISLMMKRRPSILQSP